jgi:formylglycine-generating enzyme required for sulfatase activity
MFFNTPSPLGPTRTWPVLQSLGRGCAYLALAVALLPAVQAETPQSFTNGIDMEFTLIPSGSFTMGRNPHFEEGGNDELPARRVRIPAAFYMQITEVTQEQWVTVMGSNPSKFKGRSNPVDQVSWDDVQVFLKRLNEKEGCNGCYRLPSEAEWEYAYRAGTQSAWPHGDDKDTLGHYAWHSEDYDRGHHPVAQLHPNPWGLHDMGGNVWEWVEDCYHETYAGGPVDGSAWVTNCYKYNGGIPRVLRGGSWFNVLDVSRAANRNKYAPDSRNGYDGFRVVRALPQRAD